MLPGGIANRGEVVRIGDTVHRPQRATARPHMPCCDISRPSDSTGLRVSWAWTPRTGRCSAISPGTPVVPPYPDWALTDEALVSVARLLRAYHDAVATSIPTPYRWPQSPPESMAGELVSHNDPNLDNVIFRDGRAVALIDFDLASPGSRLWDVACAARLWAPLRPDTLDQGRRRGRAFERLPPVRRQLRPRTRRTITHPVRGRAEPTMVLAVGGEAHCGRTRRFLEVQEGRDENAPRRVLQLATRESKSRQRCTWAIAHYVLEDNFPVWVINAEHLRNVPSRKTDVADSMWIAQLIEHGLVSPSFVPPRDVRLLRDVANATRVEPEGRAPASEVAQGGQGGGAGRAMRGLLAGELVADALALGPLSLRGSPRRRRYRRRRKSRQAGAPVGVEAGEEGLVTRHSSVGVQPGRGSPSRSSSWRWSVRVWPGAVPGYSLVPWSESNMIVVHPDCLAP